MEVNLKELELLKDFSKAIIEMAMENIKKLGVSYGSETAEFVYAIKSTLSELTIKNGV